MAKESMKAREVKRAKLVARYAEKRAASRRGIRGCSCPSGYPQECQPYPPAQSLQDHWSSQGLYAPVRSFTYPVP